MATAAASSTVSTLTSTRSLGRLLRRGGPPLPPGGSADTCSGVLELTGNASCLVAGVKVAPL
jgi:hypothetical protein